MGCVTSSGTKVRRKWNDGGCCLEDGLRDFFSEMIFLGFEWSFDSFIYWKRLTAVDGSGAQLSCTKTHLTVMW